MSKKILTEWMRRDSRIDQILVGERLMYYLRYGKMGATLYMFLVLLVPNLLFAGGRLLGEPTTPPSLPAAQIDCEKAVTRLLQSERYPQLGGAAISVPAELEESLRYLWVDCPQMTHNCAQKLQSVRQYLDEFMASAAPEWQKLTVLLQQLRVIVTKVFSQFQQIPRLIYGEHLVHHLQILQRSEFIQLINQSYNVQDLNANDPMFFKELEARLIGEVGNRLKNLQKELRLLEQTLQMLLQPENDVRVVGESALLMTAILNHSEFFRSLRALPIREFNQRTAEKWQTLKGSEDLQVINRAQKQAPSVMRLLVEILQPMLLNPATHPVIRVYFFQEEPRYFGYVMEDDGPTKLGKISRLFRRSEGKRFYSISLEKFFSQELQSKMVSAANIHRGEDLPVGLLLPDTGSYLHPLPPNLAALFHLAQGRRQHLYFSQVPSSWASDYLFSLLAKFKEQVNGDVFLQELLHFQLLPPIVIAKGSSPSMMDFADSLSGPDLLRALLHLEQQQEQHLLPPGNLRDNFPIAHIGEFDPDNLRQRIDELIANVNVGEQGPTFGLERLIQGQGEFSQLAKELNQRSDHFHALVVEIYQDIMDQETGILQIATLSSTNPRGAWSNKAAVINGYDFTRRLEQLQALDESYVELSEFRIKLEAANLNYVSGNNYYHFVELTKQRREIVLALMEALVQVQTIFAVTPTQHAGKCSALNFCVQAERLQRIQAQLQKMSPN